MNANKITFSPGQCRIMFIMVGAMLALFVYRYGIPAGGAASVPPAAGAVRTRPPFVVEVAGAVARPGVYSFFRKADVAEVICEAGGLTESACVPADMVRTVPENGSLLTVGTDPGATTVTLMDPRKRFLHYVPFSVNHASAEELVLIPGIGEKTALAIVSYRDRHGPFTRLQSLREVPGIGRHTFERMKGFLVL